MDSSANIPRLLELLEHQQVAVFAAHRQLYEELAVSSTVRASLRSRGSEMQPYAEAVDGKEDDTGGDSASNQHNPTTSCLSEEEYSDMELNGCIGLHRPIWLDDLLGPNLPSSSGSSGNLLSPPGEWTSQQHRGYLNVIYEYDGQGLRCSSLAPGARDEAFWQHIRVGSSGLP